MTLQESEKELIKNTLNADGGLRKVTEEMLGISVTLQRKIKKYEFYPTVSTEKLSAKDVGIEKLVTD